MATSMQKEVNVLLLGETGVGKSTFISALYNYLKFDTLNEALSGNMEILISSKFTVTDENYEFKTIELGDDSNENLENVGMSATQSCREYQFDLGDLIIRFIDSPGIGDTRGVDKDKENFENILKYISNYEYLNGICILLEPNNWRLTVFFEFCIQELLSHLHKSAKDNIVFCFTNCRRTLYRPGDTFPALKEQLRKLEQRSGVEIKMNKETIYCLDNESFRFLAAFKNGVKFDKMDETNFTESWKRSVAESVRLFEYLCLCDPHKVQDTLTLNEARKIVLHLAIPFASIEQLIQTNINLIKDRQKEIDSCTESIKDLKKRLYIPQQYHESTDCNYEYVGGKVNYKSHCHEHCYLDEIVPEVRNNSALLNIIDESVEIQINDKKSFQNTKESAIRNCEQRRKQLESEQKIITKINIILESEQKIITKINIIFAKFLRQSAIATFNDSYSKYLDHLIREERIKQSFDPTKYNNVIIEGLEKTKREYQEKIEVIKKALAVNDSSEDLITPEDIVRYEKELYNLKINGEMLKNKSQSKTNSHRNARKSESKYFARFFKR
ncbi:15669_t:CDS:1 [Racocetra fulgida]|uniref:15669_t:CDS:1 n=1 Tax=Racocetra fulgida TaxID=60492 RepID=A0A9N9FG18_9GLOM|nr:15669_t:CDS:1 [Racocetra fulgida]